MVRLRELLDGQLERFSYDEVNAIVRSLSDETQRVELKQSWPANRELAHDVCSFANGAGGVIIIGYTDPKHGAVPHSAVDGSSQRIDAAYSAIHALTSPSVDLEIRTFTNNATSHVCVCIAIPSTKNGPHEYIGDDKSNLPVRRGRAKRTLSLGEIFDLRRRAEMRERERPNIGYPIIALNTLDNDFWGVEFTPLEWPFEPLLFGHDEDLKFQNYWRRRWSPTFEIKPNGVLLSHEDPDVRFSVAVHNDGSVTIWWRAKYRPWMYFLAFLDETYRFVSLAFRHLRVAPRATMRVRWNLSESLQDAKFPFAPFGEIARRVDFARDDINDLLTIVYEQSDRLAGRSRPRAQIRKEILDAVAESYDDDPRNAWSSEDVRSSS